MFTKIINFIKSNEVKLIYTENKINLINYKKINIFDNDKIEIDCVNKNITIIGDELIITRLFNEELLIEGKIYSVQFGVIND